VHVISTLDPAHGGPPVVVARLAAAQAALGAKVRILYVAKPALAGPRTHPTTDVDPHATARISMMLSEVPGADRVAVEAVPSAGLAVSWLGLCPLRSRIDELAQSGHLVHVHELWTHVSRNASAAAMANRAPLVFTVHGMLHPWSLAQRALRKRVALAAHFRAALSRAAFIHALNADEASHLHAMRVGQHVEVIPNGVFAQEFAPGTPGLNHSGSARATLGIGAAPMALFLGRLHHKKGLDILARAWELAAPKLPTATLVVAGPTDASDPASASSQRTLALADRARVIGPVYGPDKLALLADADCFILPSRQEGFSMAILEALACGTPALISPQCCFPEVGLRRAGIVTADLSPEAFARGLEALLTDRPAARAMGARGREMVLADYTWPTIAARMLDAYAKHAAS